MEGKKKDSSSSCSSLVSDLFGSKHGSGSSSTGIFSSMFGPNNSKGFGKESLRFETVEKNKLDSAASASKSEYNPRGKEGKYHSPPKEKGTGSYYQEQKTQPCQFSSSIYYGGQDFFFTSESNKQSSGYSNYNKDGGEDDGATTGNWWQGGVYY